jgi:hypothetical protein
MLHTTQGRALAKMHRINETLTAIGTADDHFAHSTPDNDPPCMDHYNDARHAQLTGRSLVDLALLGYNPRDHQRPDPGRYPWTRGRGRRRHSPFPLHR